MKIRNHHDLWSLRGVGLKPEQLPMILGGDAAGELDDGTPVIVHEVIGDPAAGGGDETLDPRRTLLSELHPGTLAEYVAVPGRNVVTKPDELSFEEAACLPTAWLTAYRMLATKSGLRVGDTVLIQGAGGGVATAAIQLADVLGFRVWVTSRDEAKRARALELGAAEAFETGARLPERVDAVIETVGEATWSHSLRSLRPGGTIVVSGATSGPNPPADLARELDLYKSTGMAWIRVDFDWPSIEDTKGSFNWSVTDRVVNAAHSRGLKVLALPTYSPDWATTVPGNTHGRVLPDTAGT